MNNKNEIESHKLFPNKPKVIRFKKSVIFSVLLLGTLLLFIIVSYLPQNSMQAASEDSLECDAENTHWLATSTVNKSVKVESQQQSSTQEISQTNNQQLTLTKNQEEQLKEALEEINKSQFTHVKKEPLDENQEEDEVSNPKNAPIQVRNSNTTNNLQENQENLNLNSAIPGDTLSAGSLIPIIFVTEVNSELPGYALAQVTRDVLNVNRKILIPQGSKLLLHYESTQTNNERLAYKGITLMLPNDKSIALNNLPVIDILGRTGIKDKSNHHYVRNFFSMLGNIATNQAGTIAASHSLGTLMPMSTGDYFEQNGTTFFVRAGYECNLLLAKDLVVTNF